MPETADPTAPKPAPLAAQRLALGPAARRQSEALEAFEARDGVRRIWERDASLWTGGDESRWLGWLDLPQLDGTATAPWRALAEVAQRERVRDVAILGMGGSSLFPDVIARAFGGRDGAPRLHVLDSTVPAQVERQGEALDPATTFFVVASKSGGTIEPACLLAWLHARCVAALGAQEAGARFIAITDPGSGLEVRAAELGFRAVLHGIPSVGGRFSALSAFGLAPAALAGEDPALWLERARVMARACGPEVPAARNPGAVLGTTLGALAAAGRDKLLLLLPAPIAAFAAWIEQLVAESTGKRGRGIVPVDAGALPAEALPGDDRLLVQLRLRGAPDAAQDRAALAFERAGHPLVRIELHDPHDLAQEVFRWEMATAVAGAVLGIHPFDQPDVEAAKVAARERMAAFGRDGTLPAEPPVAADRQLELRADPALVRAARADGAAAPAPPGQGAAPDAADAVDTLIAAHLGRLAAGDYAALLAWVDMREENAAPLGRMRAALASAFGVAATLGFGPRYLHSTGQLHKGGPASGCFVQITAAPAHELPIPGEAFGFEVLCHAQASGDFAVLCERGRRALQIALPGGDAQAVREQLEALADRIERIVRCGSAAAARPPGPAAQEEPT